MRITDPLIKLLAIKLYEHDSSDGYCPPLKGHPLTALAKLADEDRENRAG